MTVRRLPGRHGSNRQTITVNDELNVDYAGSDEQVNIAINVVPTYTFAYTAYALKTVLAHGFRLLKAALRRLPSPRRKVHC